jgi:hypothetical protein
MMMIIIIIRSEEEDGQRVSEGKRRNKHCNWQACSNHDA